MGYIVLLNNVTVMVGRSGSDNNDELLDFDERPFVRADDRTETR